jgi:CubicO group peptidase (beta-lactamase class C family)
MNIQIALLLFALATPQLDKIIALGQKQFDDKQFSGVLLIAKDGEPVLSRAWGLADVASKTPNTVDTKFNIGSINKFFTKTAIAQLAESGKLSPDDTIRKHLPDYPSPVADKITIQQLIDHRSGLGDIFGERYEAAPPSKLRELSDFVPLFADKPLEFEPGTGQQYSNAGYIVLGLIIEKLTGETYRDYVQHHIFDPAGMKSSGFFAVDETVANRATGYTMRDGVGQAPSPVRTGEAPVLHPNTRTLPGRPSSAGGAYATAADLLRFMKALEGKKLASAKWTGWVFTSKLDEPKGRPALGIGGGAPGLNAALEMDGEGWIAIAMSNYDPPSAMVVASGAMGIIHADRAPRENGPQRH